MIDIQGMRERKDQAWKEMVAICSGRRRWTMSIPVRRDEDSDCLIAATCKDVDVLLDECERLRGLLYQAAWHIDTYGDSRKDGFYKRMFLRAAKNEPEPSDPYSDEEDTDAESL